MEANVRIGDFQIERPLGSGGMGVVYRARQLSLDRVVALKLLGGALSRPGDVARFHREAQAAARLQHPAIAAIHYIGQDNQICYMAMEYVDGVSLRQVIEQLAGTRDRSLDFASAIKKAQDQITAAVPVRFDAPTGVRSSLPELPETPNGHPDDKAVLTAEAREIAAGKPFLRRSCEIVRDVGLALDYAHQQKVTHRDVKPDNILLDRAGGVHVIDFGIARFFDDGTLTQTGQLVGTPMYMSPEQVTARIEIDHRTDIYSLGMVLYELLTLRPPVEAPTRESVLRQIVTKAAPPVSWSNPSVNGELEAVVHKAIAKDPDERYQSAGEFARDLQQYLDGKPVVARPYRHRLDRREAVASRPVEVVIAAIAFFLTAALLLLNIAMNLIALSQVDAATDTLIPASLTNALLSPFVGMMIIGDMLFIANGLGLMLGHRWANWSARIASLCIIILMSVNGYLTAQHYRSLPPGAERANSAAGIATCVVIVLFWTLISVLLLRRSTTEWFRLCHQLRMEHRASLPRQREAARQKRA